MLYAFGVGEVPISISGDPARGRASSLHTVRRSARSPREALCRLRKGDVLGVRGPYGQPWPVDERRGGPGDRRGAWGSRPCVPCSIRCSRHRADYGRVSLPGGRAHAEDLLYRSELERWRKRPVRPAGADDRGSRRRTGRAESAWSRAARRRAAIDPRRSAALVCGPEVMMRFTVRELERRGAARRAHLPLDGAEHEVRVGFCGHCQYGPFVCKDGPVFRFDRARPLLTPGREL
jgi:NAD(P)H-flavin reductase